jgi:Tfp pilus assembly protein PilN
MRIKLNLIPEYKKKEIQQARVFRFVLRQGWELLILAIFTFIALWSFQMILKINYVLTEKNLNFDSRKNEFEKIKNYDNSFKKINEQLNNVDKIQKDQIYWSYFLDKISREIPRGIVLNGLLNKDFQITLSGSADERITLLDFKNKLEKEECFEEVNLPLSNLTSKNNIDFQIEFILKNNCLKKQ